MGFLALQLSVAYRAAHGVWAATWKVLISSLKCPAELPPAATLWHSRNKNEVLHTGTGQPLRMRAIVSQVVGVLHLL